MGRIKEEFDLLLKSLNLSEEDVPAGSLQFTKDVFFAASHRLLFIFRDEIGAIEDEQEAVEAMQALMDEADKYFAK